jgi:hypothetical protein
MPRQPKSRAMPAKFQGQVRHIRGIGLRIDRLPERTKARVKSVTTDPVVNAVKGVTVDKAQARKDRKAAERKLKGMIKARMRMTQQGRDTGAADKAIDNFRRENDLEQ